MEMILNAKTHVAKLEEEVAEKKRISQGKKKELKKQKLMTRK